MAKHLFKKGQSGNPSGRPKDIYGIKALCASYSPQAIEVARKILTAKRAADRDRLKAAELILDRAFGKPLQEVKGVQISVYAEIWNGAIKRAEHVGADGRVNFVPSRESQN